VLVDLAFDTLPFLALTINAERGDSRLRPFVIAFSYSLRERVVSTSPTA